MKKSAIWTMMGVVPVLASGCCTLNQPDDPCRSDNATVFVAPGQLHVKPECVTTEAGGTITLELRRAEGVGPVETVPATVNEAATWLSASSDERDTIVIEVPEDICESGVCEFKYEIRVEGVGMLDPRVRVTR